jgi:hypothetical protein
LDITAKNAEMVKNYDLIVIKKILLSPVTPTYLHTYYIVVYALIVNVVHGGGSKIGDVSLIFISI